VQRGPPSEHGAPPGAVCAREAPKGTPAPVIEKLNIPASFVILDRVVWGVSALLGKLEVTAPWRAMLLEYQCDGPPATELGIADRDWRLAAM